MIVCWAPTAPSALLASHTVARLCAISSDAYTTLVEDLRRRAERDGGVAMAPRCVLAPLPVDELAKFLVAHNMTQALQAALRRLQ